MRFLLIVSLALLGFLTSGCGGSDETASGPSASWKGLEQFAGPYRERLRIPEGPPPEEVEKVDLKRGSGPPLEVGEVFGIYWIAFRYSTGTVRENFLKADVPFTYTYGVGDTVPGWEEGLEGMREGGVRELIVPGDLAYGRDAVVYLIKKIDIDRN